MPRNVRIGRRIHKLQPHDLSVAARLSRAPGRVQTGRRVRAGGIPRDAYANSACVYALRVFSTCRNEKGRRPAPEGRKTSQKHHTKAGAARADHLQLRAIVRAPKPAERQHKGRHEHAEGRGGMMKPQEA